MKSTSFIQKYTFKSGYQDGLFELLICICLAILCYVVRCKLCQTTKPMFTTVDENSIATIKMRNNFSYPLKMVIFSIAPHLVIALSTLR